MDILVFGRSGQVAHELAAAIWPVDWTVTFLGRAECDLSKTGSALAAIQAQKPDIVVNAAGYTAVDKAESEEAAAYALNADAPGEMADAAAQLGAALIHISTDYVFDGASYRPYRENDVCRPLSVYGASKEAGEQRVRDNCTRHIILRTSWVFSAVGVNFVRTMLRLGAVRDELGVVGDQFGGPTAAADIASAIVRIAQGIAGGRASFGTYHYTGAPVASWHGFACAIFERAAASGLKTPSMLREITTAEYPTPARRPLSSMLDCGAILRDWGIEQPSWERALNRCLQVLVHDNRVASQEIK